MHAYIHTYIHTYNITRKQLQELVYSGDSNGGLEALRPPTALLLRCRPWIHPDHPRGELNADLQIHFKSFWSWICLICINLYQYSSSIFIDIHQFTWASEYQKPRQLQVNSGVVPFSEAATVSDENCRREHVLERLGCEREFLRNDNSPTWRWPEIDWRKWYNNMTMHDSGYSDDIPVALNNSDTKRNGRFHWPHQGCTTRGWSSPSSGRHLSNESNKKRRRRLDQQGYGLRPRKVPHTIKKLRTTFKAIWHTIFASFFRLLICSMTLMHCL